MDDQPIPYLTDPDIARRLRRTAQDLAVERQRAAAASEGLEADLRELADGIHPESGDGQTMGALVGRSDQGRLY